MPSLRVLTVAALVGLGAVAGAVNGTGSDAPRRETPAALVTAPQSQQLAQGEDTRAENARPGATGWRITRDRGGAPGLSARASAPSVAPGEPVTLQVTGTGPAQARALRIGWYGGDGARQVWAGTVTGSAVVATTGWPAGHYLLRVDRAAASRYVPLTVRSPDATGRLLVVTSPLTWVASAGDGTTGTFDRPFTAGFGAGGFLTDDLAMVQLAERDGSPLAYTTDADLAAELAADRAPLAGAAGVAFGGSRAWTPDLRRAVLAAVRGGTNAAFLGAGSGSRTVMLSGRTLTVGGTVASPALTGLRPACPGGPGSTARGWVVSDPTWWGYRGAGVESGTVLPGLVSGSADTAGGPGDRVAESPMACKSGSPAEHSAVYWTTPAGAGVFATGTSRWVCTAGDACLTAAGSPQPVSPDSRRVAARVTRAVLQAFAAPRAGARRPAGG